VGVREVESRMLGEVDSRMLGERESRMLGEGVAEAFKAMATAYVKSD
jgi:hypothetical protein